MTATIMMSTQIESAIRDMCTDAMSQAVNVLAKKYGFDSEDANRFLASSDMKIVHKRGPSPKTTPDDKTKSKGKKETNPDKPKRGKTGYLLYADEIRAEVKAELLAEIGEDEKLKPQDVVKAIAARWKAEDSEVKAEWNDKAKTPATSDDEMAVLTPKAVKAKSTVTPTAPKAEKTKAKTNSKDKPVVTTNDDGSDSEEE